MLRSLSLVPGLAALAIAAHAEEAPPRAVGHDSLVVEGKADGAQVTSYHADTATTATKIAAPLIETPQTVSVLTRDLLDDRRVSTTIEALSTVPGFAPGVTYLWGETYSLRGFANSTDTPYNKYRDGHRAPQFVPVDPDLLERIEVVKGPASVLYGQIEPGGLVNHVSKRVLLDRTTAWIRQSVDSDGFFKTVADANIAGDSLGVRLPATFGSGQSFRDEVDQQGWEIAPTATWAVDQMRWTVLVNVGHQDKTDDTIGRPIVNGEILDVPRERFLGEPDYRDRLDHRSGTLEWEQQFTPHVALRVTGGGFHAATESQYALTSFVQVTPGQLARFGGTEDETRQGYLGSADLMFNGTLGATRHDVVVGVDTVRATANSDITIGFLPDIDIANPVYGNDTVSGIPFYIFDSYQPTVKTRMYGIYLQERAILIENQPGIHHLSLLAGARFDVANADYSATGTIFGAPLAPMTVANHATSPRAGLVWMPTYWLSTYGSYAQSFQPQDAEYLSGQSDDNPDPTIGRQLEAGIKAEVLPQLFATMSVYQITKTNIARPDVTTPGRQVLTGEARSRGIEWDVTGELAPSLNLVAAFALIKNEVTQDENPNLIGKRLVGAPDSTASLWTSYTLQPGHPAAGLGGGTGFTAISETFADEANEVEAAGYATWDAGMWYRGLRVGAASLDCSLNLKNITDTEYVVTGNGFNSVANGSPRSVVVTAQVGF